MSSEKETGSGGASITPSARPSIHQHRNYPFTYTYTMGRYGLEAQSKAQSTQSHSGPSPDQGRDEVDNIQSKFARGSSPLAVRHLNQKRNSLNLSSSPITDDSENSIVLAKSCPPNIQLNSYSSDDFGNWTYESANLSHDSVNGILEQSRNENASDSSEPFTNSNRWIHSNPRASTENTLNQSRRIIESRNIDTEQAQQSVLLWLIILGALVAIACAIYYGNFTDQISTVVGNKIYNKENFYSDLNHIGEKYNIKDTSILQIQAGIATIFERQDTGSFVLTYKSSDQDFDQQNFNDFINTIASYAAKYLRNDSTSVQHLVLDGSKLKMETHSELINKYRETVTKTGVMLVKELDKVPSSLAMAFHYYCDEYNPLVKKSAIFFTLDMEKCSHNPVEQEPSHSQIEKCLKKKWSGVPQDNINPLLNRVVNTVVDISGQ